MKVHRLQNKNTYLGLKGI